MNLRHLEYFVAIADAGSFTGAAERLLVAQPSLSHQIRALELELGGTLLERLPRGVRLTAAGQAFLADARLAIAHSDHARRAAHMALGLQAGELQIATFSSAPAGLLPPILRRWQERYPDVELSMREFINRRLLEAEVRGGFGDVAISVRPPDWSGPVERLGWEEFLVVLPHNDPLLRKRAIDLAWLADRRWVHYQAGHGLGEIIDLRCAQSGFSPQIAVRTGQVATAPQLAASGLGPTLAPDHVVPESLRGLARPVRPPLARQVVAFARQEWSPIARAFLEVAREHPWPQKPRAATQV